MPSEIKRIDEIVDLMRRWVGDRPIIGDGACVLTGRELADSVDELAETLRRRGVRPGDRVIVALENTVGGGICLLAAARVGAWVCPLNARLTDREIEAIQAHAGARLSLYASGQSAAAEAHARTAGASPHELTHGGLVHIGAVAEATPEPVEADSRAAVAAVLYTSGTTGKPKGVMLTHANLLFVARTSGRQRKLTPADHVYLVLPISHVFGLASMFFGTLYHQARLLLAPRYEAARAASALAEQGISIFQGVPTMFQRLLEHAEVTGRPVAAPNLRFISSGGAPLDLALKRRIEEMWGLPLHNGYGLTETSPTVTTTFLDPRAEDDTVGRVAADVEVRIADPETGAALPAGMVGEIWVRGPNIMKGYYHAPAETAAALTPDGWFRSGDLGRLSENGNLYIAGRIKELIIRSGFNVYPPEVEAVLNDFPGIVFSAVVGVGVPGNEEVVAFLQPIPGAEIQLPALEAHVAERLAPYKRPARYHIRDALPMTTSGKVRKTELKRELAERPL
ncbi:MAG: class I adenylate-forming enzyme family protein [Hyphomicrobiaceae bacterium]